MGILPSVWYLFLFVVFDHAEICWCCCYFNSIFINIFFSSFWILSWNNKAFPTLRLQKDLTVCSLFTLPPWITRSLALCMVWCMDLTLFLFQRAKVSHAPTQVESSSLSHGCEMLPLSSNTFAHVLESIFGFSSLFIGLLDCLFMYWHFALLII